MTTKDLLNSFDVSSRSKRRRAAAFAIDLLDLIRAAEEAYMDRVPENLRAGDAFANAELSLDAIADAIAGLADAY